jgi:hypothetical protein
MSTLPPPTGPPLGHPTARADDDGCSAKNTTVAALTTTTPIKDATMAPSILIPIAADAKGGCHPR